jgi:hypothetical protein
LLHQSHGELEILGDALSAGHGELSVQTRHARSDAIVQILQFIQQGGSDAAEALAQSVVFGAARSQPVMYLLTLHGG